MNLLKAKGMDFISMGNIWRLYIKNFIIILAIVGKWIRKNKGRNKEKVRRLLLIGFGLIITVWLVDE